MRRYSNDIYFVQFLYFGWKKKQLDTFFGSSVILLDKVQFPFIHSFPFHFHFISKKNKKALFLKRERDSLVTVRGKASKAR
jgi:hypothetical protein